MDATCYTHIIAELFAAHGIKSLQHDGIAYPAERLPAIRATWYPGESVGRLNVDVFLDDKRCLQESFAGFATDDKSALGQAMDNFCGNSLHVLLAALWGVQDQDMITRQTWQVGDLHFDVYIGHLGLRGTPRMPESFIESITTTIQSLPLDKRIHWFRHYYCSYQRERTVEALCDGQPFQSGIDNLNQLDWEDTETFFSVRNFLMLVPAN